MNTRKKKSPLPLFFGTIIIATGIGAAMGWLWWKDAISPVVTEVNQPNQFTVESGMSGQQIGNKLAQQGLIQSPTAWKLWTKWQAKQDAAGGFKA